MDTIKIRDAYGSLVQRAEAAREVAQFEITANYLTEIINYGQSLNEILESENEEIINSGLKNTLNFLSNIGKNLQSSRDQNVKQKAVVDKVFSVQKLIGNEVL